MKQDNPNAGQWEIPIPEGSSKDFKAFAQAINALLNERDRLETIKTKSPDILMRIAENDRKYKDLFNTLKITFNDPFHKKYAQAFTKKLNQLRQMWGIGPTWEMQLRKKIKTKMQPSYFCFHENIAPKDNKIPRLKNGKLTWVDTFVLRNEMNALCAEYVCPVVLGYKMLFHWKQEVDQTIMTISGMLVGPLLINIADVGRVRWGVNPEVFSNLILRAFKHINNRDLVSRRSRKGTIAYFIENHINKGEKLATIMNRYDAIHNQLADAVNPDSIYEQYKKMLSREEFDGIINDNEGVYGNTARKTYHRIKQRIKYYPQ